MKTIQKIFFLTFLFWALFLSKILSAKVQPNIIIFLVDDMGAMDTSVPFIADKEGRPKKYPLNEMYHTPAMEKLRTTSKIVEWEKKKRAKRIKNVLQCPMC